MANLNKVLLIGNLTRDPELRYTPNGTAVVNLGLAVNRRYKDKAGEQKDDTCFLTVVVWNKQAEACNQYLQKGRSIFVEGTLQQRSWQDAQGQKRTAMDIRADRVQFLGAQSTVNTQSQPSKEPVFEDTNLENSGQDVASWLEEDKNND
ncbi:MAG: single-stranded DNA-binding protein [Candidatus Gygaella obscura]|nr:single-stranded DNA-binding protein [Candidatus Gygaella obscura]